MQSRKDIEACPHEELKVALAHPQCLVPGEKEHFLQVNSDLLLQLRGTVMPLEGIAPQVFEAIYQRQQGEILWVTVLWMIAQLNGYWVGGTSPPLPSVFQINCGGLGGGALEGEVPPHFHCTCPPVGESQVYGPSLSPADVLDEQEWGVAYGWSTGVHEVATLFALTQNPCQKWEALGYGKATLLYQRTQHVLQAARLLPAHRRLPHPGLSQWSLVEASFATATAASTVRVYQRLEDQLAKAGSATEDILALTTTREGATNLRNYFSIADKKANAETAVKVAGATAKHCIVIHGVSTFLSGEGRHLDYDQECFTRANVAYSRATDLTILACPLNMQGMPGAPASLSRPPA